MMTRRHLPTRSPFSFSTLRYAVLLAALAVALAFSAQQAEAQTLATRQATTAATPAQNPDSSFTWANHFGDQLRQLLNSPDRVRQEEAMLLILEHKRRPFMQARGSMAVDFRPTTASLFDIYESDAPRPHRMLALAALDAIGEPSAMKRLARQVQKEAPGPVRRQALHILAEHSD